MTLLTRSRTARARSDRDPERPGGLPDPEFYVTGGTMPSAAESYVVRQADSDLYDGLRRGEFCYVLNTRQIGKSSLMLRAAARLRAEGAAVAVLDLTAIGQNVTPAQWYNGLLSQLGQQVGMEDALEDFWDERGDLGPLQRFFAAVRQGVLPGLAGGGAAGAHPAPPLAGRLVLFIDEIDAVRSLPFSADEFFVAIRECFNRRVHDPAYEDLNFCLVGVATPADLIRDTRLSPFNIGRRVTLTDFTPEEAAPLSRGLGPQGPALLSRVLYWTGGHPYLTQRVLRTLADEGIAARTLAGPGEVDRVCDRLFFQPGERESDDNLAFVRNRLLQSDEVNAAALLERYRRALSGLRGVRDEENDPVCDVLRLAGIVKPTEDGRLVVRNRIYARVFPRSWVESHLPEGEVVRQRAAYRRGVLRSSLISGVIVLSLSILAAYAFQQKTFAEEAARRAAELTASLEERGIEAWAARSAAQASAERADRNARDARDAQKSADRNAGRARAEAARARAEAARANQNEARARTSEQGARASEQSARESAWRARQEAAKASEATERAVRAEGEASQEAASARRYLYVANVNLMQKRFQDAADLGAVRSLLRETRPEKGQEDLRGFEWDYMARLSRAPVAVLNGHRGTVTAVAYSPDGRRVVTGGRDGHILVHDPAGDGAPRDLTGADAGSAVTALSCSPDGALVASGHDSGEVVLRDLATGATTLLSRGGPGGGAVYALAFSPDGKRLLAGGDDRLLRCWDLAGRRVAAPRTFSGFDEQIRCAAFSPDARRVAVGLRNGRVSLREGESGAEIARSAVAHDADARAVAFSRDGETLASAGDTTIRLWDARTLAPDRALAGHAAYVYGLAFAPKGTPARLVSASWDRTIRVWEIETGEQVNVLRGHAEAAWAVAVSPDGKWAVSGGADGSVHRWDLNQETESVVFTGMGDAVTGMAITRDERALVAASDDNAVYVFDLTRSAEPPRQLKGHARKVKSVLLMDGDARILSTSDDATLRLWDRETGACLATLRGHAGGVNMAAAFPDGRRVVTGSDDGTAIIWDVPARRALFTLRGHRHEVNCVAVFPDGKTVATGSDDGTVLLWSARDGRKIAELDVGSSVNAVAIHPDGKRLVTGSSDYAARVWDAETHLCTTVMKGHVREVWCVALSPDGRRLVTGSHDGTTKIWDMATSREMLTLRGHRREIKSVAFAPGGRFLLTGSRDRTARLWDGRAAAATRPSPPPSAVAATAGGARDRRR